MSTEKPFCRAPLVVGAAIAALLLLAAARLPLWRMDLDAPQYPNGLHLTAYGTYIAGDLREINIINHYVGMDEISEVPAPEMKLYPLGLGAAIALTLAAPLALWLTRLAIAYNFLFPVIILADLQWWLYRFGHDLDPKAPLRFDPFTPLALGRSKIGNFASTGIVSWGTLCLLAAGAVLIYALRRSRSPKPRSAAARSTPLAAPIALALLSLWAAPPSLRAVGPAAEEVSLQRLIDSVPAGGTLTVEAGPWEGPIVIDRSLTVLGRGRPVIDGRGIGNVVEIRGTGVVFRGFEVRNSSRDTSKEPAGIKVRGSGHFIEDNWVHEVYFGIHLSDGSDNVVRANRVEPGLGNGIRAGHAISVWNVSGSRLEDNIVSDARDGIYLSFADDLEVKGNRVTGCRYGVHSMYSKRSSFSYNTLEDNQLGAALMYSEGLSMRCNTIRGHRRGATAYGVLLKDIDDLILEHNHIVDNRVGIYADSTPLGPGRRAEVLDNFIAGNGTAMALQSTAHLEFFGNRVADNLIDVRAEGSSLSPRNQWSANGRGNYWSSYRGYDADGDGVGDLAYRYERVMSWLLHRSPAIQAFVLTPAHAALEQAARMFPLVRPKALLEDSFPLMAPPPFTCSRTPRETHG